MTGLRDEVIATIANYERSNQGYGYGEKADAVLGVVRERLLEQITANRQRGFSYLRKEDVLALLGEER